MKALKERLKRSSFTRKKVAKALLESEFYKHYFAEAGQEVKDSVAKVHKVDGGRTEFNFVCKRMNKRYLGVMFQAEGFRHDFFEYLEKEFLQRYADKVQKKIVGFLEDKIPAMVGRRGWNEESVKRVCNEIMNNPKWKIPWTVREAENAVVEFDHEFNVCLSKGR